jgi:hypothetical protein
MNALLLAAALSLLSNVSPGRFAVVVGANDASPGRERLRFAHDDARAVAEVLGRTGAFPPGQVRVLLDPEPDTLLKALEDGLAAAARAGEGSLLVFYYSGHADGEALYPAGKPLLLSALRSRIERPRTTALVGIIDACRGGAWTRAKGVAREAPLEIASPLELATEGSALLSSSSGAESAHESEALSGSFFTHHLVAGLSGAADANGDGEVTLGEVFAYAKELTVRDSSLQAEAPQHPSFLLNLRGRTDLPLAHVGADAPLELRQDDGPLQLVQLSTGLLLAELPQGKRAMRLAVAPGRYVIRTKGAEGIRAKEVEVGSGGGVVVDEASLELVGSPRLTSKGAEEPVPGQGTWVSLQASGGPGGALRVRVYPYSGAGFRLAVEGMFGQTRSFGYSSPVLKQKGIGAGLRVEWVAAAGSNNALLIAPGIDGYHGTVLVYTENYGGDISFVPPDRWERPLNVFVADVDLVWIHRFLAHFNTELGLRLGYFRSSASPHWFAYPQDGPEFQLLLGLRF